MSNRIKWNDSYSVGIDDLDNQHKQLLVQFNNFVENSDKSVHSETFSTFLGDITRFAREHFENEEQLLKKMGLDAPHMDLHKESHFKFVENITDIMLRVLKQDANAREDLVKLFTDWFKEHIEQDKSVYKNILQ